MRYADEVLKKKYEERLERIELYVRDHYGEDLRLEKLAEIARLSKYHFHRVFKTLRGETVHSCIRRIRLEESRRRLREENHVSVSEIALRCGFSNPQNFARAFKAHFGLTPLSFRRQSVPVIHKEGPLGVKVKDLPSYRVASIRYFGPYPEGESAHPYHRLLLWAIEEKVPLASALGISAAWNFRNTPPAEWTMDACLTVPEIVKATGEVRIQDLPGGKFAVIHHSEVPRCDLRTTALKVMAEWLPSSGCQFDLRPVLFIMYNNPNANPGKLVIADICVPIKPL